MHRVPAEIVVEVHERVAASPGPGEEIDRHRSERLRAVAAGVLPVVPWKRRYRKPPVSRGGGRFRLSCSQNAAPCRSRTAQVSSMYQASSRNSTAWRPRGTRERNRSSRSRSGFMCGGSCQSVTASDRPNREIGREINGAAGAEIAEVAFEAR